MSVSIVDLLDELEKLAAYDGPWTRLRDETPLLRRRVAELREREARLDDVLVIALVGGSGVGKSTLLNALAGDQLARTSEFRPCTERPTVYHPPGVELWESSGTPEEAAATDGWKRVSGSALEHLVIIDTPDSDTIIHDHREQVAAVLGKCDLIMLCGSAEKYLDEATWSLLRPLQGERTMVCIETKALAEDAIRAHWLGRLKEQGFEIAEYFRVNALRSLDRKLAGAAPDAPEIDFPKLEAFLRHELTTERINRIKRSNAAGLLVKTVSRLSERVEEAAPALAELEEHLIETGGQVAQESLAVIQDRLFAESHLWTFALGRETGLRAKGLVGSLFRIIEALRSLPARLAGWLPWIAGKGGVGRGAASLLSSKELFHDDLEVASEEIAAKYQARHSEVALACARAGFDAPDGAAAWTIYRETLNRQVTGVLRGPARDGVIRRARLLTSWPATLLADLPPLAFIGYAGYIIVSTYFTATLLDMSFLIYSATVLAILLGAELFLLSLLARLLAWSARRRALRSLRAALTAGAHAFQEEDALLANAKEMRAAIKRLHGSVTQ